MTEKRYSHDGVTIIDHLKKDLIYIEGKENLLEIAEYVDKLQDKNEQLKQGLNDDLELIGQLQEENKELKQRNTELIKKIDFLERVIDGDVEWLKKE